MTTLEFINFIALIFEIIACILIDFGIFMVIYPIASGQICSYNAPCGLKDGYDCSKCEHKIKKGEGIIRTIVAMFSFGQYKG